MTHMSVNVETETDNFAYAVYSPFTDRYSLKHMRQT